jgi:hypothetical protein
MVKTTYALDERIMNVLENNDISVSLYAQYGEYVAELEWCSPAGEDFGFSFYFNGLPEDFVDQFTSYAADFDPEEHAVQWYGGRGAPGLRELLDDADAIDKHLQKVAAQLANLSISDIDEQYVREHWEDVLKSNVDYSDISHAIGWVFYREDLETLMALHKQNKHRQKIEDLLEDCNYHTECGDWHDGNYVINEF